MLGTIVLRFMIGGLVASTFAAIGEAFNPKSFSGLCGAAPSVAIASLAIAFASDGAAAAALAAKWMLVATAGMFAYATSCVVIGRRERIPMWLTATASWLVWGAVNAALWFGLTGVVAR